MNRIIIINYHANTACLPTLKPDLVFGLKSSSSSSRSLTRACKQINRKYFIFLSSV